MFCNKRKNILKRAIFICKIVRGEIPETEIMWLYHNDRDYDWVSRWRIYDMIYRYKFKESLRKRGEII